MDVRRRGQDRSHTARDRAAEAGRRIDQLRDRQQQLAGLLDDNGAAASHAERAAQYLARARQAHRAAIATAVDAYESAALAHDRLAGAYQRWAESSRNDRLLRLAAEQRELAAADRGRAADLTNRPDA